MNQAHQIIALRIPRAFVLDEASGAPSLRGLSAVAPIFDVRHCSDIEALS